LRALGVIVDLLELRLGLVLNCLHPGQQAVVVSPLLLLRHLVVVLPVIVAVDSLVRACRWQLGMPLIRRATAWATHGVPVLRVTGELVLAHHRWRLVH
jgi:hypothetical protein